MDGVELMPGDRPGRAAVDRWRTGADMLARVRREKALTRVSLAASMNLASASATEVTARLRALGWLREQRAEPEGRGRPTTVVHACAATDGGPVVLAVELRYEDWRCAVAGLDGQLHDLRTQPYDTRDPWQAVHRLPGRLDQVVREHRVVAIGVAVAAAVHAGADAVSDPDLGWGPLRLRPLTDREDAVPVLVGNDATLAGVAEARAGAAAEAETALYVTVEVGVGGALLLGGSPQTGAHGAAGEFGHLPFGEPDRRCPCGARACWQLEVDGRALARRLGEPEPSDPRDYALRVLRAARGRSPAARAVADSARALGRGVAGLVNALDPEVVILGGLGPPLRAQASGAFGDALHDGLMAVHRRRPPPVLDAAHGDRAVLRGAAEIALDKATGPGALARQAESQRAAPPGHPALGTASATPSRG